MVDRVAVEVHWTESYVSLLQDCRTDGDGETAGNQPPARASGSEQPLTRRDQHQTIRFGLIPGYHQSSALQDVAAWPFRSLPPVDLSSDPQAFAELVIHEMGNLAAAVAMEPTFPIVAAGQKRVLGHR